ncbi:MAG: hypothetical protein GXO94_04605, partial [Nitrospirae bacterium]|nr:hypothetical protein [Nitrospirota bacterium]
LVSCSHTAVSLKKAKKHWSRNDFEWLAGMEVECKPSDEGCNQLHLMKGDACYRLAKAGKEPLKHFECAATSLERGIRETRQWRLEDLDLNRAQTYENLCESLRELQFMKKGVESEEVTRKLRLTAEEFLASEPGSVAAVYFLNKARLVGLADCLNRPDSCPRLCREIESMVSDLRPTEGSWHEVRTEPGLPLQAGSDRVHPCGVPVTAREIYRVVSRKEVSPWHTRVR